MDRKINVDRYPKLFYPETYLLEGGYSKFHPDYPELCEGSYTKMEDDKENCMTLYTNMRRNNRSYSCKEQSALLLQKHAS